MTQSDELKRLRDEVSSLQKDLKDTVRLEQEVGDLNNELKRSRNEMDSLQKERKDLKDKIGVKECEVSKPLHSSTVVYEGGKEVEMESN